MVAALKDREPFILEPRNATLTARFIMATEEVFLHEP